MTPPLVTLMSKNDSNFPLGAAVRVDGWPLFNRGLYTMSIHFQSFIGQAIIEAALTSDPADEDWFEVYSVTARKIGSHVCATTITGRYTWMRVRAITHMGMLCGAIDKVILR